MKMMMIAAAAACVMIARQAFAVGKKMNENKSVD